MVSDLSPGLYNEWVVPRFLQCGGYADHIEIVLLWFSSGGTKSVLHTDTQENLHCLVSGTKKFVIIKPYFAESIGPEHKKQGFFNIDVERQVKLHVQQPIYMIQVLFFFVQSKHDSLSQFDKDSMVPGFFEPWGLSLSSSALDTPCTILLIVTVTGI